MTDGGPRAPLFQAALCQLAGALAAAGAAWAVPALRSEPLALAALQGTGAALASRLSHGPPWWLPIHLGFLPLAVLALGLGLPSWVWLAGFFVLLLVFWRTDRSRVPLYLSNAATAGALAALLPARPVAVLDLGCGDGRLLRRLARARPDCRFVGIEHAPLTWAFAHLASRNLANVDIRRDDIWRHPLTGYACVYAFLSPAPMPRLWQKARAQMPPAALLVSNSFAVPGVEAESVVDVGDGRGTRLYCYLPGAAAGQKPGDCPAFSAIEAAPDRE